MKDEERPKSPEFYDVWKDSTEDATSLRHRLHVTAPKVAPPGASMCVCVCVCNCVCVWVGSDFIWMELTVRMKYFKLHTCGLV